MRDRLLFSSGVFLVLRVWGGDEDPPHLAVWPVGLGGTFTLLFPVIGYTGEQGERCLRFALLSAYVFLFTLLNR